MNNSLVFSKLRPEDAKELSLLDKECFSTPWSEQMFYEDATNPNAHYVLARIGDKIVGYCGIYMVLDEGQITNIAVLKKYRGQKIASSILEKIVDYARENNLFKITLEVRESNAAAIGLYEKFGFKKVGYRKGYYHNPQETAVLMDLQL